MLPLTQVAQVIQLVDVVLKTALKSWLVGVVKLLQAFAEQRVRHRIQPRFAAIQLREDARLKRAQFRRQLRQAQAPKPLLQAALVLLKVELIACFDLA